MQLSELQRAALIGVAALVVIAVAGFFGMQMLGSSKSNAAAPVQIPSRNDCINDGLRNLQSGFSRQTAYDIEVRCEQLIQSLEARSGKPAQR